MFKILNDFTNQNKKIFDKTDKVMYLCLYIEDEILKNKYIELAALHNEKIMNTSFPDAGFDLIVPNEIENFQENDIIKINHFIKSAAVIVTEKHKIYNTGFYMYPRSSISNTNLRMCNSVGVIDSGYRGHLIGKVDCINSNITNSNKINKINKYDRLFQIVAPSMEPILVYILDSIDELGCITERGDGGFGSTGK